MIGTPLLDPSPPGESFARTRGRYAACFSCATTAPGTFARYVSANCFGVSLLGCERRLGGLAAGARRGHVGDLAAGGFEVGFKLRLNRLQLLFEFRGIVADLRTVRRRELGHPLADEPVARRGGLLRFTERLDLGVHQLFDLRGDLFRRGRPLLLAGLVGGFVAGGVFRLRGFAVRLQRVGDDADVLGELGLRIV